MSFYGDPAPFDRIASPAILLESAPWRDEAGRWRGGLRQIGSPIYEWLWPDRHESFDEAQACGYNRWLDLAEPTDP